MLNIAICDDDFAAVETVKKTVEKALIQRRLDHEIYCFDSPREMLKRSVRFDIAFLDIEMPEMNGMELSECLRKRYAATLFVFITSHEHYMDDALMLQPHGFLRKPIDRARLCEITQKLVDKFMSNSKILIARTNDEMFGIKTGDIVWAGIEGRKVHLHTLEHDIAVNEPFEHWRRELSDTRFCQIHQSYIINMSYVKCINKSSIALSWRSSLSGSDEQAELPVSVRRLATLKRTYFAFIGGIRK